MSQKLGQLLIKKKIITEKQLETALEEHNRKGEFLGSSLIRLGYITEKELFEVLTEKFNITFLELRDLKISEDIIQNIPVKFVRHYKFMPVGIKGNKLTIALANPFFLRPIDDIKLHLGYDVEPVLARESDIASAIKKYYGIAADTVQDILDNTETGWKEIESNVTETAEDIEKMAGDASVVKLVSQILQDAVKQHTTDIHIEPFNKELTIRYRVDGILYDTKVPEDIKYLYSAIVSRIKIMSGLDIVERRVPQDGRAKIKMGGEEWELRVSIIPTLHGENVVIRILPLKMLFSLSKLGLSPDELEIVVSLTEKPHGIIFLTGPTGSGKTTTLYACLNKINTSEKKIITIEDPVEYELKGVSQIQVSPKVNLTFAVALRSMLRHDPDVMMVGEVRDFETAEITIRTALTGHLVFSTLHTNDAATGIARLIDMGIEPYLVASSVEAFIAQRLVRTICPSCKEVDSASNKYSEKIFEHIGKEIDIFKGKGCRSCRHTGYKGRIAIYEFLLINDRIKDLIVKKASSSKIKEEAVSIGMVTLRQEGWKKVAEGITTIEEVLRVS